MVKILLITQAYYPYNSPPSHRIHSFAKYLREYNFKPTVLCVDYNKDTSHLIGRGALYDYDPSLEGLDVCRTVRVPFIPLRPGNFAREIGYMRPLYGSEGLVSVLSQKAEELYEEERYDAILASSGPPQTLVVANHLSVKHAIPWIADLRDIPGQHSGNMPGPAIKRLRTKFYQQWSIVQETKVCKMASMVTTVSQPLADVLKRRGIARVEVVYNGYDEDDYCRCTEKDIGKFRIVYAGTLNHRSPELLFDALDLLLKEKSITTDDIEVSFFGSTASRFDNYLMGRLCKDMIRIEKWKPRREIQETMMNASLLLQLSHPSDKGIMTSKIFEYLAARRFILSVPKDHGVIDELLYETGAGQSASDPHDIARIIREAHICWQKNTPMEIKRNEEIIKRYSRRSQVAFLSSLIHSVSPDCISQQASSQKSD